MSDEQTPTPETNQPQRAQWWINWPLGVRVVVRRTLDEGGYSDSVGELLYCGTDGVTVRTRKHGDVHIPAAKIAVGKVI